MHLVQLIELSYPSIIACKLDCPPTINSEFFAKVVVDISGPCHALPTLGKVTDGWLQLLLIFDFLDDTEYLLFLVDNCELKPTGMAYMFAAMCSVFGWDNHITVVLRVKLCRWVQIDILRFYHANPRTPDSWNVPCGNQKS